MYVIEMAEQLDTMSSVKLDWFRSQLKASCISSSTEEVWYNETVCLWYIYTHTHSVGCDCIWWLELVDLRTSVFVKLQNLIVVKWDWRIQTYLMLSVLDVWFSLSQPPFVISSLCMGGISPFKTIGDLHAWARKKLNKKQASWMEDTTNFEAKQARQWIWSWLLQPTLIGCWL